LARILAKDKAETDGFEFEDGVLVVFGVSCGGTFSAVSIGCSLSTIETSAVFSVFVGSIVETISLTTFSTIE
jgi:hypothetical protein